MSTADLDTDDLAPIDAMIGEARIVGLSEGIHGAAEPMIFRNRLFKHLVERLGFQAIGIESGIVESRPLNDYVVHGKGDLQTVLEQGLSVGSHTFRQNGELIRWMRAHNAHLAPGAPRIQIFGLDVSGSPGIRDGVRRPDTALRTALDYLRTVDAPAAAALHARIESYLPILEGTNGYGELAQAGRDTLTAAIADLVSLLERQRPLYVSKSTREDFDWAERAAVAARQIDDWFRRMPLGWKLEDGFDWTRYANQVRDRSMADNFDWMRRRLPANARVLVFTSVGHMASTIIQIPDHPFRELIPFGAQLEYRHGAEFVSILNLVVDGEIQYCSSNPRRRMPLESPVEPAVETWFAAVNEPRYLLDLRRAPAPIASWLHAQHDHFNGFGKQHFATADAFDLVYFVSPVTSACTPLAAGR